MKKKLAIVGLSVLLLVAVSVAGTLAWLTDRDTVTNTFTVGDVQIELDEANVNKDDTNNEDRTTEGNEYHLIPGQIYTKDPTVTVKKGSEESYVRMLVTVNCLKALDEIFAPDGAKLADIFGGYDPEIWIYKTETRDEDTITYEFRYKEKVNAFEAEKDLVLKPLFTQLIVPGTLDGEDLAAIQELEIVVEGHAIQTVGFKNEDEAWENFVAQWEAEQEKAGE